MVKKFRIGRWLFMFAVIDLKTSIELDADLFEDHEFIVDTEAQS